jgi:hypothetical protein
MSYYRLIVMRLKDMRRVHPEMDASRNCQCCNETVGIYPSGRRILQRHPDSDIVCSHCVSRDDVRRAKPAPGALAERGQSVSRQ